MHHVARTGDYHNIDDVFHDDGGSDAASEHTRLLPSATASESEPSSSPPLKSQPAHLNMVLS